MFEDIKTQVMGRIYSKRDEMQKIETKLCPKIMTKVNKAIELTKYCEYDWDEGLKFEVSDRSGKYKVDIEVRTCSCGVWQLSGIPCYHGAILILHTEQQIENYVDSCYYVETYLKLYNHLLSPIEGSNEWPPANMTILLPPPTKKIAGRPKKNRRKDPNEEPKSKTKSSKKGTSVRCSMCKEYGHNKLGCKMTPVEQASTEPTPQPIGEPRKSTPQQSGTEPSPAKLRVRKIPRMATSVGGPSHVASGPSASASEIPRRAASEGVPSNSDTSVWRGKGKKTTVHWEWSD